MICSSCLFICIWATSSSWSK